MIIVFRSLFKKKATKKRSGLGSSSIHDNVDVNDVSCYCPDCMADPIHCEAHHRNEDARATEDLHRAFGDANINDNRAGEGPSSPHPIHSSMDTGDEPKASYDEGGEFRNMNTIRGSYRGAGLIQHKCILSRIMSDRIGARLSTGVKIKLMYTPFHHFMDSGALVVDSMLLDDICGRYIGESQFCFGAFVLTCTDEDFGKILGLPHVGRKIDLLEVSSKPSVKLGRFYKEHLHGKILTRQKIGVMFRDLANSMGNSSVDEEDIVRLYLCLLFSGFLFTNARCTLRRKIISYIEDLDDISSYNWAGAVRDVTFSNIDYCRTRVLERERGGRAASVYMMRCPAALMVWALEHTHVAEPGRPDGYLPYQRWVDFKMDGGIELGKLAPNLVSEVPRTYKLEEEDADMDTETSTEGQSSSSDEDGTSNEVHDGMPDDSDDLANSSNSCRTPEIVGRDLCVESSNKPKRQSNNERQMQGRNLLQDLDNADDVSVVRPPDLEISDDIQRKSGHVSVGTDRWWYYPCNEDQETCLDFNSNDSQGGTIGTESTKEASFFSSCPGLSGIDIYGNPEHGGLQVECSKDSRGNIFRRNSNPGYLTATLPSYPEERGPKMDTPFVVDADGFIMYVDGLPTLWSEVEGHGGDSMHMHDVEQFEISGASSHDICKMGTDIERRADSSEKMVVSGEDMTSRNAKEPDLLELDVPSRVQRIKNRREHQRNNRLERERIAELEAAVMKEEVDDLMKYKNERKKRYSRIGFAKELQMIGYVLKKKSYY
ncbi:hypothetical protein ZOSMA_30G01280 [Zostera marina]|uniref:Aminotransferase-like plant mobile domain-containing protein n=1 Tax=Zostera marina TaxID=29655 RepID=A0A0K9PC76_ZOSMR|nr:hypothetical protein ZOSMA_30G01280 [Zostera marina]